MTSSARQSTFPYGAGSSQSDGAIAELCVHYTLDCVNTLGDVLIDLEEQNRELKRIGDAITYNRMYVLLPEKRVREYSIEQSSEIEPQITELLQLAEKSVKNLERREAALKQKISAQEAGKSSTQHASTTSAPLTESEERRKKLVIRQRHIFEKERLALEKECRELQRQLDAQEA